MTRTIVSMERLEYCMTGISACTAGYFLLCHKMNFIHSTELD